MTSVALKWSRTSTRKSGLPSVVSCKTSASRPGNRWPVLDIEVLGNFVLGQKAERNISAEVLCLQLELEIRERVLGLSHLIRAIRGDDAHVELVESRSDIGEKIDGRCVRPVNVLQDKIARCRSDTFCSNAPNSRFSCSCDDVPSPEPLSCALQFGANRSIASRSSTLAAAKLSSDSRIGKYASVPARRSEHRPRATATSSSPSRNVSTNVVLPIPASPATVIRTPCDPVPASASFNARSASSRPTSTCFVGEGADTPTLTSKSRKRGSERTFRSWKLSEPAKTTCGS